MPRTHRTQTPTTTLALQPELSAAPFMCAFLQLVTGNFMYMTVGLLERK